MEKNYYEYNAGFIEDWLRKKDITKNEFQSQMGMTAQSYYRWVENKANPMPIEYIIKFCNKFGEDISNFFLLNGESVNLEIQNSPAPRRTYKESSQTSQSSGGLSREKVLELKLTHMQELQQVRQEANDREKELLRESRQREDKLRKEYEDRIEEYRQQARDNMECMKLALTVRSERQSEQTYRSEKEDYSYYGIMSTANDGGIADAPPPKSGK